MATSIGTYGLKLPSSPYGSLTLPGSMPNSTLPGYVQPTDGYGAPSVGNMADWGNAPSAVPGLDGLKGITSFNGAPGATTPFTPTAMQELLGYKGADGMQTTGYGGLALGAASGAVNAFMGMKQYGLAKDSLENSKMQFEKNYAAQKTTTNSHLEDRQVARVASNAGAYQSVGDYMKKNAVV